MDAPQIEQSSTACVGHCNFEPGTYEWREYQRVRRAQLQKLKNDREKRASFAQLLLKAQENLDGDSTGGQSVDGASTGSQTFRKPVLKSSASGSQASSGSAKSTKSVTFADTPKQQHEGRRRSSTKLHKRASTPPRRSSAVQNGKKQPSGSASTSKQVSGAGRHKKKSRTGKKKDSAGGTSKESAPDHEAQGQELVAAGGPEDKKLVPTSNGRQLPPKCPDLPPCKALPGTKAWDDHWKLFEATMSKYNLEMAEFEKGVNAEFGQDLNAYAREVKKLQAEERLAQAGMNLPLVPTLTRRELDQITVFNGYVLEAKNINAVVSNQMGHPDGIRVELNIKGFDPNLIQISRDHNIFTVSVSSKYPKYLRIGVPEGKSAEDIEIYPPTYSQSIMIIDSR